MSIDFDSTRSSFESFITEEITGVPTTYENAPDSLAVRTAKDNHTDWVRVTVKQASGFALEIGKNPTSRWPGLVMISLFGQLDKGTKSLRDRASSIASSVTGHHFTGVQVRTPEFNLNGRDEDWYQATLTFPIQVDQTI